MANKAFNELTNGTTPQDGDRMAVDRGGGPWSTVYLTMLSVYNWILGKLEANNRAVPTGGTTGQVLRINGLSVPAFETVGLVPAGSVVGYVLRQTGAGAYDNAWGSVRELPEPDPGGLDDGKFVQYDGGGSWVYALPPEGLPAYTAPADNGKVVTLTAGVPTWETPSSGGLTYRQTLSMTRRT